MSKIIQKYIEIIKVKSKPNIVSCCIQSLLKKLKELILLFPITKDGDLTNWIILNISIKKRGVNKKLDKLKFKMFNIKSND